MNGSTKNAWLGSRVSVAWGCTRRGRWPTSWSWGLVVAWVWAGIVVPSITLGAEPPAQRATAWTYAAQLLQPFWLGDTVHGESVLFVADSAAGPAKASLYFPIEQVVDVRNSAGDVVYEAGRDYEWTPGSRELRLPPGSRIVARTPAELRRPANSQKYQLTHRDGQGEIFFGGRLEYHELQTVVTYRHAPQAWSGPAAEFRPQALPATLARLRGKEPLTFVVLGDSISSGCNASGWADGPPFQPAYPELLRQHLEHAYGGEVTLHNLSISGRDTAWALTMVDQVIEARPQLVVLAMGMNDSAGRSAAEYRANTQQAIEKIRAKLPHTEFILVATMLGNRDWTRLRHELFPEYRDALNSLRGPGVEVADLTSVWTELLKHKRDWDLTGNGVNHPNDFGHRVYAQVLGALLVPPATTVAARRAPTVTTRPVPDGGQPMAARTDAKGTIHLVYQSAGGPRYVRSDDNGKSFGKALPIVDDASRRPGLEFTVWDMATDDEGRVHVALGTNAWKLKLPQEEWGFFYTRLDVAAAAFEPLRNINRKPSEGFSLAADGHGNVTACWLADKLYSNVSHDGGKTFEPSVELDASYDPCNCCTTSCAYGADGKLGILYREETDNKRDIFLVLWDQQRNERTRRQISTTTWEIDACPMTYYQLSRAGQGYLAVWPTRGQVYFARLDAAGTLLAPPEIKTPGRTGMRTGILALDASDGGALVAWKNDEQLGWQRYDGQARPIGASQTTASRGKGLAGVRTRDGDFVLFK